jgi:hypothetical protein
LTTLVRSLVQGQAQPAQSEPEAAATREGAKVSAAQIAILTEGDFETLKYSLVVHDGEGANGKPKLRVKDGQYVLVPKAQQSWYVGLKGLEASMRKNGALGTTPNSKGRTQIQFARELFGEMSAAGFVKLPAVK